MEYDQFLVRFWGVRGSYPVPGPTTLKYGGNTPCVEVQVGGHTIILDGGTGLIHLGNDLIRRSITSGKPITATILFTHTHHDHTQGMPYFIPAYMGSSVFYIFGPRLFQNEIAEALAKTMLPPNFPLKLDDLQSMKVIRDIRPSEQLYLWPNNPEPLVRHVYRHSIPTNAEEAICIDVCKSYAHPQEGVFFYRISYKDHSMVYATDTEGYVGADQKLRHFAMGTDLLIHDAQYLVAEYRNRTTPRQGWGHSTAEMAVEVAKLAKVKRLAFFHLDPSHDDHLLESVEARMKAEFEGAFMGREGLTIDLFRND
jgi:phosphoribosyl 1,2-cyclic phosphodiesterase